MNNRTVNASGDINNSLVLTGDNPKIYVDTSSSIWEIFEDRNLRATRNSHPSIDGLDLILRDAEISGVEGAFNEKKSALIVGESGTGKSGLGFLLMDDAKRRKQPRLMLDCRNFYDVSNSADLQAYLSLGNLSLSRACLKVVEEWPEPNVNFLLVFDQVDNIAGSAAGREIIQTALDCHGLGINVVVISRQKEVREEELLAPLNSRLFHRVESVELLDSLPYFKQLKIIDSSEEVVELGRNLLNLSLIAAIHQKNPDFDFSNLTNDVMLWKARLDVFRHQHTEVGDELIAELGLLAAKTLESPDGTFLLDNPERKHHNRLISEGFIKRRSQSSRICIFSHENLQNFVYAANALKDGMSDNDISRALGLFRAQNVIVWREKIARVDELEESIREARLRSIFNVQI